MKSTVRLVATLACVIRCALAGLPARGEPGGMVGRFADGTTVSGSFAGWGATDRQPSFAGRSIAGDVSLRWAVTRPRHGGTAERGEPESYVELRGGDRLPGVVEGYVSGRESLTERLPPHLLVKPLVSVDPAGGTNRGRVRVVADAVRRIVRTAGAAKPGTVRLAGDGREVGFQSLRWTNAGVLLLTGEGATRLRFDEIADLRLPDRDPWDDYVHAVAVVAPDAGGRIVRCATASGAVLTAALGSLQRAGNANQPVTWEHGLQPAWSLDPLWLRHADVGSRWFFAPHEPPLVLADPVRVERKAVFGGSWAWRANRNVQGAELSAAGVPAGWGFGTQAGCNLFLPLPAIATGFRAGVALDDAAGSGGCAQARVCLDDASAPPLWQSQLLIGTAAPVDTGPIALRPNPAGGSRLVLAADMAHEGRPPAADPFDVRDLLDWLDPVLLLDPAQFAAIVQARLPATIPAWKGWDVAVQPGGQLVMRNIPSGGGCARRVIARGGPLALGRSVEVTPDVKFLVVGVSRDRESPSRIEIRADGVSLATADVPERAAGRSPDPFLVPLDRFAGRTVKLEVVHAPSDDKSLVEWHVLETAGPLASTWEPLEVVDLKTRDGSVLTKLDDGSVLAGGPTPKHEVYTVRLRTTQQGITGLRLDSFEHPSMPRGGPSRFGNGNRNFVITNVAVTAAPLDKPDAARPVALVAARATNTSPEWLQVDHLIDADPRSGWCNTGEAASAVLTLAEPVGFAGGTEFVVILASEHAWTQHLLGRFRLSTTTAAHPSFDLPGMLVAAEATAPAPASPAP